MCLVAAALAAGALMAGISLAGRGGPPRSIPTTTLPPNTVLYPTYLTPRGPAAVAPVAPRSPAVAHSPAAPSAAAYPLRCLSLLIALHDPSLMNGAYDRNLPCGDARGPYTLIAILVPRAGGERGEHRSMAYPRVRIRHTATSRFSPHRRRRDAVHAYQPAAERDL